MKIVKNIPEWVKGIDIPINGKFVKDRNVYQCVLGSGHCSSHIGNISCCFDEDCTKIGNERIMRCTGSYRQDKTTVSFILIE